MDSVFHSPRVEVYRGFYLESVHFVSGCVVRANGEVLHGFGDIDTAYPIRSLAKPFIARELIRCGAAAAYGLGDVEIALASGSHDGEERHVAAVRVFLARVGVDDDALSCGPALEGKAVVGAPIANNCSGKHAAVLAMCRHLAFPTDGYLDPEHVVQKLLVPALVAAFGCDATAVPLVVDGCGMPIFCASLRQIATTYARLGISDDDESFRVRAAMAGQPEYVGGWNGNLDTRIIRWSRGTILGKIGAEGLHADTAVGKDVGIALKVLDGNSRALPPTLARLFSEFIDDLQMPRERLAELATPPVLNAAGRHVGEVRTTWNPRVSVG